MNGLFSGLIERKSLESATRHAVSASPSGRSGTTYASQTNWDSEKAVTQAYERVIWVFRCVDVIAQNQAMLPMISWKGDPKRGHPTNGYERVLRLLNQRPNPYEDAFQFRYRLSSQLLLSTRGAFIEIVGDPRNPDSLHLIPPNTCEPIPHETKFVSGYRVLGMNGTYAELKPEQVIWVKAKPHPLDPYKQMTPLVAAGLAAETDYLARLFNRNFLMSDGRPSLLVTIRGQMMPDDAQEIKRRFSGGPTQAGQTTVIEGDGVDVADLGASPRDVQWLEGIAGSKQDILLAFGVPESVMGNASNRTFDNADAERENYWKDTEVPHCLAISKGMDVLTGSNRDDICLQHDFDMIDVLQRQDNERKRRAMDDYARGKITWNEMRKECGLEEWPDILAANLIVHPGGFAFVKNKDQMAEIMSIPTVAAVQGGQMNMAQQALGMGGGALGADPSANARAGAIAGGQLGERIFNNNISARTNSLRERAMQVSRKSLPAGTESKDAGDAADDDEVFEAEIVHPYDDSHTEFTGLIEGLLTSMDVRQEKVLPERLDHAKVRKGTRHWEGETKAVRNIDPDYITDTDRWAREMREEFEAALRPALMKEALKVAKQMQRDGILAEMIEAGLADAEGRTPLDQITRSNPVYRAQIVDDALNPVLDILEARVRAQSQRVGSLITSTDGDGADLTRIKKEVRKMVGSRSKWRKMISGAVTTSALEGLREALYSKAGQMVHKTWNAHHDGRTRPTHLAVDGVTVQGHERFQVGVARMTRPGDPTAPIEETANCRCYLTYAYNTSKE